MNRDQEAELPNDWRRELGEDIGVELPAWNRGHSATLRSDRDVALTRFQRSRGISKWSDGWPAGTRKQRRDSLAVG